MGITHKRQKKRKISNLREKLAILWYEKGYICVQSMQLQRSTHDSVCETCVYLYSGIVVRVERKSDRIWRLIDPDHCQILELFLI